MVTDLAAMGLCLSHVVVVVRVIAKASGSGGCFSLVKAFGVDLSLGWRKPLGQWRWLGTCYHRWELHVRTEEEMYLQQ